MEKETAEIAGQAAKAAADSGLLGWIGGIIVGAFAWLLNRYHRSIGHRINNNSAAIGALSGVVALKADSKVVDRMLENQATIFTQQRQDRELFVGRLTQISDDIHKSHAHLIEEVGDRPTRDEVNRLIELHQARRSS